MDQQKAEEKETRYVLVADVNQIKEYISASVRLRHIVTASALLAYINEIKTEEIICEHCGEVIFTSGGVTQAIFPNKEKAEHCKTEIEALYPRETHSATIAVHCEPWEEEKESFVTVIRRALRAVRREKDAGSSDPDLKSEPMAFFSGSPFFRVCEQTGREFATILENGETYGAGIWKLQNWKPPQNMKGVDLNTKYGDQLEVDTLIRESLKKELGCELEKSKYPSDFELLVKGAAPSNYLGFISADGNGFGNALSTMANKGANKDDYKSFSTILKKTTCNAFVEAAVKVLVPFMKTRDKSVIPLRILMMGGDDVLAITLPQLALPLANEFCRIFQCMADDEKDKSQKEILQALDPFTMSAGVVIAHHKFPFLSFQRLGKRLLKNAKRRAWHAKSGENKGFFGSVDFQIITASGADDLKTIREDAYTLHDEDKTEIMLTGRPYLVSPQYDELRSLRHTVAKMRKADISRRQVKALSDILLRGRKGASLYFLRWFSGLRESQEQQEIIRCLLETDKNGMCLSPWIEDKRQGSEGKLYTPLIDAAELFDMKGALTESDIGGEPA